MIDCAMRKIGCGPAFFTESSIGGQNGYIKASNDWLFLLVYLASWRWMVNLLCVGVLMGVLRLGF